MTVTATPPANPPVRRPYDRYEGDVKLALIAVCERLCPRADEKWRQRERADATAYVADGQTRALLEWLWKEMKARDASSRLLFGSHVVSMRVYNLVNYLRGCTNKYRYESLSQQEQLADAILFRELLTGLEVLLPAPSQPVTAAMRELDRRIDQLFSQAADARSDGLSGRAEAQGFDEAGGDRRVVAQHLESALGEAMLGPLQLLRDLRADQLQVQADLREVLNRLTDAGKEAAAASACTTPSGPGEAIPIAMPPESVVVGLTPSGVGDEEEEANGEIPESDLGEEESYVESQAALTPDQARDALVGLRWMIWEQTGSGPGHDGVLRKRLLDTFIRHRITCDAELSRWIARDQIAMVDPAQLQFLPEVYSIVGRIPPSAA